MKQGNDKIFIPKTFIQCGSCGDVICSLYSGHYVNCSCWDIAIDETEHYLRFTGCQSKRIAVDAGRLHKELYWLLRIADNFDTEEIDYLESKFL